MVGKLVGFVMMLMLACLHNSTYSMVIPSPMDPMDKCIFTCDYCFQEVSLLKCANECIDTSGKMPQYWTKACPELEMPLYIEVNDLDHKTINDISNNLF